MSSIQIVNSSLFKNFILASIVFASVLVGIETYPRFSTEHADTLQMLDRIVLAVFLGEIALKLHAYRARFFQNRWNLFDLAIVLLMFVPSTRFISVLRVLRVARLVTHLRGLQHIIDAAVRSFPVVGNVLVLLGVIFYLFGVVAVHLFGENDPLHFGNLQRSLLSLLRVATMDGWTELMAINSRGCQAYGYWEYPRYCVASHAQPIEARVFFPAFVITVGLILMNLFAGAVIHSMDKTIKGER